MYLDVYVGLYLNGDKFRLINVDWKTQLPFFCFPGGGEEARNVTTWDGEIEFLKNMTFCEYNFHDIIIHMIRLKEKRWRQY